MRCFATLIKWLGIADEQNHRVAVTMLLRLGQEVTPLLVREAIRPGKRSKHRIAILDVVQQIGGPLEMDELFSLQSLLQDCDPHVRAKATVVIMSASPGGVPKTPEAAALALAFNPFLATPPRCRPRRTRTTDFVKALHGDRAAARRLAKSNAARQKREERERAKRS